MITRAASWIWGISGISFRVLGVQRRTPQQRSGRCHQVPNLSRPVALAERRYVRRMQVCDLRSDTLTRPTAEMRAAMAKA